MLPSWQVSVIIPVLNEAAALPRLLQQLRSQVDVELDIIVVDGGSSDRSQAIPEQHGARLFNNERGRARQMNRGAREARFDSLLFLHGDSSLPGTRLLAEAIVRWQAERERLFTDRVAGHFKLRFERAGRRHNLAFRYLEEKSATNRRQTINGDQGLLISKRYFDELGGFDESMPIMEDQAIADKIFTSGHWILLPGTLYTSGRRFEREGFHRRYILMSLMMGLYWTGAREFFQRARGVYRAQQDSTTLRLSPFFAAVWAMLIKDFGWRRSIRQWYKVGAYVRANGWQLFFFIDVLLLHWFEGGPYPLTAFHDRLLKPLLSNPLVDGLITIAVFIWYMLVLAPMFFILDRRLPKQGSE